MSKWVFLWIFSSLSCSRHLKIWVKLIWNLINVKFTTSTNPWLCRNCSVGLTYYFAIFRLIFNLSNFGHLPRVGSQDCYIQYNIYQSVSQSGTESGGSIHNIWLTITLVYCCSKSADICNHRNCAAPVNESRLNLIYYKSFNKYIL